MKKSILLLSVFLLLCFVGCQTSWDTAVWFEQQLQSRAEEQEILVFQPNPMYEYPIVVTEELLALLDIEGWEESNVRYSEAMAMLYCDVSDDQRAYRAVFFSNGDILLQEYKDGSLKNGKEYWYQNESKPDGQLFDELIDWIDEQCFATNE
ncbi:MAG: hypothetical protein IJB27_00905 [Clostridia bacterium]|nr:hypothetical protein [Clostridia bacterium]